MRAYLVTTGALFGLLIVVHVWRVFLEGPALVRDPWFISINVVSAALCVWAFRILARLPRS